MPYLKIKKMVVVEDQYGSHIEIKMVGLYESKTGKWMRWVKVNQSLLDHLEKVIINTEIPIYL